MSDRLPRTAVALLVFAGAIVLADLGLGLAGGRAAASVLTGTDPGGPDRAVLGALYVLAHLGAVILAPILAIAALLRSGYEWLRPAPATGRSRSSPAAPTG